MIGIILSEWLKISSSFRVISLKQEFENIIDEILKLRVKCYINRFNEKPTQFISNNEFSCQELASKLLTENGIKKKAIGEFFGKNNSYSLDSFKYFLNFLDFEQLDPFV